jgi:hypothetical protein
MRLRRLTANLSTGKVRRETLHGRQYLVAPATILNPGVLNGSKGALYYPPEEVAKHPGMWNGMPLVVYHPTDTKGHPVTARDPTVIRESGIGAVYQDSIARNGKRRVEAWFDEELTGQYDQKLAPQHRMLPRLLRGEPIELSTGLWTDNKPTRNGLCPKTGRAYTHTALNYRPDHIAILPDHKGACSVVDGCGVHNSSSHQPCQCKKCQRASQPPTQGDDPMKLSPEAKKSTVKWLVQNCACWKGAGKELMGFPDERLVTLKNGRQPKPKELEAFIGNQAKREKARKDRASTQPSQTNNAHPVSEEDEEEEAAKTPTTNKGKKGQTDDEYINNAPPGIQRALKNAMRIEAREKGILVAKLVQNMKDGPARQAKIAKYKDMDLDELEERWEDARRFMSTNSRGVHQAADTEEDDAFLEGLRGGGRFNGAEPSRRQTSNQDDGGEDDRESDTLPLPTLNWEEQAKIGRHTRPVKAQA